MYSLPYFKEKNFEKVLQFIKKHSFAFLIGCDEKIPVATQVPFLIDENNGKLYLKGHIMRNTDHHKAFEKNENVLCVFTGAHSYVSASWYSNPQTASTWNYLSVHAKGSLTFLDENHLIEILKRTTERYENNPESPSLFDKLPGEYVQRLIKAIIAFEIEIKEIDNIFKLSQNRDEESYTSIIDHLEKNDGGAKEIAHEMKIRSKSLFKKTL